MAAMSVVADGAVPFVWPQCPCVTQVVFKTACLCAEKGICASALLGFVVPRIHSPGRRYYWVLLLGPSRRCTVSLLVLW